jgi:hypothetical protein
MFVSRAMTRTSRPASHVPRIELSRGQSNEAGNLTVTDVLSFRYTETGPLPVRRPAQDKWARRIPRFMKRFKKILVATDTRLDAHPIVDEAAEIARHKVLKEIKNALDPF